jgi:hypothetical protein
VSEHGLPVELPGEPETEFWAVRDDDGHWRLMSAMRQDGRLVHHVAARGLMEDTALAFLLWMRSSREAS